MPIRNERGDDGAGDFPADKDADMRFPGDSSPLAEGLQTDGSDVAIARFGNAAEAGFFAHELSLRTDALVDVRLEEHFDAVVGFWSTRFVLCVPADNADELAAELQDLVQRSEHEELFHSRPPATASASNLRGMLSQRSGSDLPHDPHADHGARWSLEDEPRSVGGVPWGPIVLSLAAGSIIFWGLRTLHFLQPKKNQQAAAEAVPADLWEQVTRGREPVWVQQDQNGRTIRRLIFNEDRSTAVIEEDTNGDGRFDTNTRLQRPVTR